MVKKNRRRTPKMSKYIGMAARGYVAPSTYDMNANGILVHADEVIRTEGSNRAERRARGERGKKK